ISGRIFATGVTEPTAQILPLIQIVSRELGASIHHVTALERSRRVAIVDERIRLARDLHDGVLQALTGIRLELQAMAASDDDVSRDRKLLAIERALSAEQAELRRFIQGLRPGAAHARTES